MVNHKTAPWRENAIKRGYRSSIAIPLFRKNHVLGSLTIYSADPSAFNPEETALLEELASDLAFGIETMRTRLAHEQQATLLRQSLEQSIQTIASTVEARDPYTAGHQVRVAQLATAIAREMGLPEEQVNGIQLAAIVHDLGKIHIPAEILARPGKISDIEFSLIKTHPQAGYDILKDVKFPWPIAEMVLQHHEKLDGSGYPRGLKGGQIILESRILTVADVVEAMSSHRPYRPALGIDAALDEVTRKRGAHYDPQVVDACIKLFKEKNYVIPD
jgi:putative nucleotidyltransferase with HDIG domain